ncbi:CBS domain-containing protein [Bradyrhizobium sp. JR3.5]
MEQNRIKRVPVTRDGKLVGILCRSDLLRAVAGLVRHAPDSTADDEEIRKRIIDEIKKNDWSPHGLNVIARDGVVHLSGIITDDRYRAAAVVAAENVRGVVKVHDHLRWIDTFSGMSASSPEDEEWANVG